MTDQDTTPRTAPDRPASPAGILVGLGFPARDLAELPTSPTRFPDGAQYRVEIPSTEGPECLTALFAEADQRGVQIHRVSQGSGVFLHTNAELDAMAELAADRGAEVSLFARPTAGWGTSASSVSPAGSGLAATVHGADGLADALDDVLRAYDHGFRSVLVSDIGLLSVIGRARQQGLLPADLQAKVSVMLPAANPATAAALTHLGANTLNLPTDLSLAQIAAIRAVTDIPLDIYVEAPDNLGGFVRLKEIPELVRVAAPVYLKFGLRNAPDIYPSGTHLEPTAVALTRERVRRATLGLEILQRANPGAVTRTPEESIGLAVPQPSRPREDPEPAFDLSRG